ncbi:hypothetical protein DSO57_1010423 [Entomophthora muscae]|uniref:Uncharacterized protein n=1 Tax=Entomophthora muscae TaxID=34485 RepID=A0ACC2S8K7_9FUNG|nr:hypothetical protein DSO57_1010423 [Entomophthora muscae]
MLIYNLLLVPGVSCFCRERNDIRLDSTRYLAALRQLNSGPAPTTWHKLISHLTPDSFNETLIFETTHQLLNHVEDALQEIDSSVTIPFWSTESSDIVFSASRFGAATSPYTCMFSIPLSEFKHKDGTCLKRRTLDLDFFKTLNHIPPTTKGIKLFQLASAKILEALAQIIFQSRDVTEALDDPLFLSVLARLDAARDQFLMRNQVLTNEVHSEWNDTIHQGFDSRSSNCIIYNLKY